MTQAHKKIDFTTTPPPSAAPMPSLPPPPLFLPDSYSPVGNDHRFCRLDGGGSGETKASSSSSSSLLSSSWSSSLSSNKFGTSARRITRTPLANARANDQANATTKPRTNAEAARRRWRGRQGETKASSSSLLSLLPNKFCASARTITKTPRANARANDQANATTNPRTNAEAARRRWRGR
jgi:hypothetical protein